MRFLDSPENFASIKKKACKNHYPFLRYEKFENFEKTLENFENFEIFFEIFEFFVSQKWTMIFACFFFLIDAKFSGESKNRTHFLPRKEE